MTSTLTAAVIYSALTGQPWVSVQPGNLMDDATRPPLVSAANAAESIARHGKRGEALPDACTIRDETGRVVGARLSCKGAE